VPVRRPGGWALRVGARPLRANSQGGRFRRLEVVSGALLPDQQQEIRSGLAPGQMVVSNALMLQNSQEQ